MCASPPPTRFDRFDGKDEQEQAGDDAAKEKITPAACGLEQFLPEDRAKHRQGSVLRAKTLGSVFGCGDASLGEDYSLAFDEPFGDWLRQLLDADDMHRKGSSSRSRCSYVSATLFPASVMGKTT